MNIIPNLQFIIIVLLTAVSIFTAVAVIFYKLGKREKQKLNQKTSKIIKVKNEIPLQNEQIPEIKEKFEEKNKITTNDNKPEIKNLIEEKKIYPPDLYSKKIEKELKSTEEEKDKEAIDKISDFKLLKYTSNGYKPAKGDKESKVLRWR